VHRWTDSKTEGLNSLQLPALSGIKKGLGLSLQASHHRIA